MKISVCETIVDEKKFVETHTIRANIQGRVNEPFKARLKKYLKLKDER
jgi:hypothetical protein